MVYNLRKAQKKWARLMYVLGREGGDAQTPGLLYIAVMQAVLLYGSETWFMPPRIEITLQSFHHRVVHILMGWKPRKDPDRTCVYSPLTEAMLEVGLQEVEI